MKRYIRASESLKRYNATEQAALDEIYDNLQDGIRYGEDWLDCRYPFFSEALSVGYGRSGKKYIFWSHFGSSANDNTKRDLHWILEVIFKMTPTEFLNKYIPDTESKVDYVDASKKIRSNMRYVKASSHDEIYETVNLASGSGYYLSIVGIPMGVGDNGEFEYDIVVELCDRLGAGDVELDGAKICRAVPSLRNFISLSNVYADEIYDVIDDIKDYFSSLTAKEVNNVLYDLQ